ncbi:MAG: lysophospholipid acyltransferase family protein [Flavobacteriaceae bacterium]|nr:lysophospholipid acyltransferase family protein [Flavobacteriaceae bacterium]
MKSLWYHFLKLYVSLGLSFFYKKIRVHGIENIPKNKAVMFLSNHPNALIDPLLIATNNQRNTHYLTRAAVFNNPIIKKLLYSINMIPVYRTRDGIGSKKLKSANEEIFSYCYEILNKKKALLIFPEGSHNIQRRVRSFRKGFARIVFGAMDLNNDLEIDIIPVGVNYTDVEAYASKVSIYFSKPISVRPYWEIEDRIKAIQSLKTVAYEQLKSVTNHIDDEANHDTIVKLFKKEEFLNPKKVNKKLESLKIIDDLEQSTEVSSNFNPLLFIVKINSFFPLLIWKNLRTKINEREFIATFKFAIGITAFPVFYFLQTWVVNHFFGSAIGYSYLIFSFLSVFILTKTKK